MDRYCPPESLTSARLLMRRARPSDADAIFEAYGQDPEVTRYLSWKPHKDIADTREFLEQVHRDWDAGHAFAQIISLKDAPDQILGMIHTLMSRGRVGYGYLLKRDAWGHGYMTETLRAQCDNALAHPAIYRCEAYCDVDHPASQRVMEKAGLRREGILRRYMLHPNISNVPRDCVICARIKEDLSPKRDGS